jgi:hypothetical protein
MPRPAGQKVSLLCRVDGERHAAPAGDDDRAVELRPPRTLRTEQRASRRAGRKRHVVLALGRNDRRVEVNGCVLERNPSALALGHDDARHPSGPDRGKQLGAAIAAAGEAREGSRRLCVGTRTDERERTGDYARTEPVITEVAVDTGSAIALDRLVVPYSGHREGGVHGNRGDGESQHPRCKSHIRLDVRFRRLVWIEPSSQDLALASPRLRIDACEQTLRAPVFVHI